jgi:putative ABC transport system permease protein
MSTAVPVYDVQTLDQRIESVTASAKFNATVAGIFAVAALVLAAIGVYSVLAFTVAQQTREIGVRTALGAPRGALMASVMRQGATLAFIGVIVGVGLSLGATRGLRRFVTGVGAIEPGILAGTSALFMLIALAAALVPAYRATRIDPLTALRGE